MMNNNLYAVRERGLCNALQIALSAQEVHNACIYIYIYDVKHVQTQYIRVIMGIISRKLTMYLFSISEFKRK